MSAIQTSHLRASYSTELTGRAGSYEFSQPWAVNLFLIAGMGFSSFTNMRLTSIITFGDGLLIVALTLLILRFLASSQSLTLGLPSPAAFCAYISLIVVGGTISSLLASDPAGSFGGLARILFVALALPLLASSTLTRSKSLIVAVYVIAIAAAVQGLGAILQLQGIDVPFLGPITHGRLSGFSDHVNHLGSTAASSLPIGLCAVLLSVKRPLMVLLFSLCCLLSLAAVIVSGSVASSGGAAAGMGVMALYYFKFHPGALNLKATFVSGLLVVGCLTVGTLFIGPMIQERLDFVITPMDRLTTVRGSSGTAAARFETVKFALSDIYKNPFVGVGFSAQDTLTSNGLQVHNAPLMVWHSGGVLAAVGYLGVILIAFRAVRLKSGQTSLRIVQAGILGSLASVLIIGLTQPVLFQRFPWVPVLLAFSSVFSEHRVAFPGTQESA